jgi:phage terminase Nu1 subunit (DNA packaging protein)
VARIRLDSWKSIAEYLERSTRTVQRWHAYHGLPVHHFGGSKGSVFGYAEEIDHWLVNLVEETRTAEMGEDEALEA